MVVIKEEENKGFLVHLKNPNIYSLELQKSLLLTMICH